MKKNFTPIQKHLTTGHHTTHASQDSHDTHDSRAEEVDKHKTKTKKKAHLSVTLFVLGFCLYLFVSLNIVASQKTVPDLYFSFVTGNQQAVSDTLDRMQYLPEYPQILAMQREIYGPVIDEHILQEKQTRESSIKNLEAALQQNTNSRDILYALSILYRQNGNDVQSQQYLERAKEVDPWLK